MTQTKRKIENSLKAVKLFKEIYNQSDISTKDENKSDIFNKGATLLGVHLEGPFISKEFKGAQSEEYIQKPEIKNFEKYNNASGNSIKIVTIAPEEIGAEDLIEHLKENGIIPSIGHSNAKYEDVEMALEKGASCVTHTFNAQSALHHRNIGVVGSALLFDELFCEVIADGIHVSIPALKLLVKNKPKDKVILITDSMRAKGLGDGQSELGGQFVNVKNGEARLNDGTLAGSVLKMNNAIKIMFSEVGVPLENAIDFASLNPAKNLKIDDKYGSIKEGKIANFAVMRKDNFEIIMTIVNGEVVYQNY